MELRMLKTKNKARRPTRFASPEVPQWTPNYYLEGTRQSCFFPAELPKQRVERLVWPHLNPEREDPLNLA